MRNVDGEVCAMSNDENTGNNLKGPVVILPYPEYCHRFACLPSGSSSLLFRGVMPMAASRIVKYFLYLMLPLSLHLCIKL